MKANKGKEFIPPDKGWNISEASYCSKKHYNVRRFHIRIFNRKLRKYFNRLIKKENFE